MENGARSDPEGIEARVLSGLGELGLDYTRIEIDPDYAETAAFCERYGFPLANSANTILVASKREPVQYAACVVAADTRLDVNHKVRALMGVRRLSFAGAEQTAALTGMMLGGVTVLALPRELPVYVDAGLLALEYVILGGGSRACKIRVSPELFKRLPGVQIVEDLAIPN